MTRRQDPCFQHRLADGTLGEIECCGGMSELMIGMLCRYVRVVRKQEAYVERFRDVASIYVKRNGHVTRCGWVKPNGEWELWFGEGF